MEIIEVTKIVAYSIKNFDFNWFKAIFVFNVEEKIDIYIYDL